MGATYAPTYEKDVKPIIDGKCAVCHKGPFLDLQTFPFFHIDHDNQVDVVRALIKRIDSNDKYKMPPVNGEPLSISEIQTIKKWFEEGLAP